MTNDAAERGLVGFAPDPAHKRSSLIRLTEAGERAIGAGIERERTVLRQIGGGIERERTVLRQIGGDLTEAEIDACLRVLSGLPHLLDDTGMD
ncbi:hypothetical protein GCM10009850_010500 [Nonomuraea monospora]|uniref:MarR family transcriptional regulator n=1 Tax=Nonomuraea monospora TaxID=568818 RepID=A0ABP5P197_9ACTN